MNAMDVIGTAQSQDLVLMLSGYFKVAPPRIKYSGRSRARGRYQSTTRTIKLAKETRAWVVVHEFAHHLNHVINDEPGRPGYLNNGQEPHSRSFYYNLRRVIVAMAMSHDYPWKSEYKAAPPLGREGWDRHQLRA